MMGKYPETNAVLVRRHGVYVWGGNLSLLDTVFHIPLYIILTR